MMTKWGCCHLFWPYFEPTIRPSQVRGWEVFSFGWYRLFDVLGGVGLWVGHLGPVGFCCWKTGCQTWSVCNTAIGHSGVVGCSPCCALDWNGFGYVWGVYFPWCTDLWLIPTWCHGWKYQEYELILLLNAAWWFAWWEQSIICCPQRFKMLNELLVLLIFGSLCSHYDETIIEECFPMLSCILVYFLEYNLNSVKVAANG